MNKICIIGAGKFGLALYKSLDKKNEIAFVSRTKKHNLKYIDYDEIANYDYIFFCIPSNYLDDRISELKNLKGKKILITEKCFDLESEDFVSNLIEEKLSTNDVCFLSGANISSEIIAGKVCSYDLSSKDITLAEKFKKLFLSKYIINTSTNIYQNQLAGIYKNIVSIGSGIVYSLSMGENFRNYFISKSLEEYENLLLIFDLDSYSDFGTKIGDLFLSANSKKSRNFKFGYTIIKENLSDFKSFDETVEGLNNLNILHKKIKSSYLDFRITKIIYEIIHERNFDKKYLKNKFEKLFL
ncbi:MAG: hypothetical protein PHH98_02460 [Candidatus Gracilibacteria bacterium]|nr:hypothetical protein [Candidatus Gracilibacteria bacterium]